MGDIEYFALKSVGLLTRLVDILFFTLPTVFHFIYFKPARIIYCLSYCHILQTFNLFCIQSATLLPPPTTA